MPDASTSPSPFALPTCPLCGVVPERYSTIDTWQRSDSRDVLADGSIEPTDGEQAFLGFQAWCGECEGEIDPADDGPAEDKRTVVRAQLFEAVSRAYPDGPR